MSESFPGFVMVYRFGNFDLNAASRCLTHAGRSVAIQPKPFELLLYLIRHRDRVVSRAELLSEVWRGVHVDDVAVRFALHAVRRAVRDDGRRQAIIRTAQRAGFQFVAPVRGIATPFLADTIGVERNASSPRRERLSKEFESLLEAACRGEIGIVLLSGVADTDKTCAIGSAGWRRGRSGLPRG